MKSINTIKRCAFYAAPEFISYSDISRHFFAGDVVKHSALFSAKDIKKAKKLSGNMQHSIAYEKNSIHGYLCSEPAKIKRHILEDMTREQSDELVSKDLDNEERVRRLISCVLIAIQECEPEINQEKFNSMVKDYINARYEDPNLLSRSYGIYVKLRVLRFLVRNYLDSEMMIL